MATDAGIRTVLMTSGLRPVARAYPKLPGNPVGVIIWDKPSAFPGNLSEIPRKIKRVLTRKPYASLKDLCKQHNLHYATCDKSDANNLKQCLKAWNAELVITSGCAIIPMEALDEVPLGAINVHPSPLPNWKGANPLFWQLAAHEEKMGVTVHELTKAVDCGDILGQRTINRPDGLSHAEVAQLLEGEIGAPLLGQCISEMEQRLTRDENGLRLDRSTHQTQTQSTTHYARSVKPQDMESQVPLQSSHPGIVWNLLRYLGKAPADWIGIQGWHRKVAWAAVSHHYDNTIAMNTTDHPSSQPNWRIEQGLLRIRLVHPQGSIRLAPARLAKLYRLFG